MVATKTFPLALWLLCMNRLPCVVIVCFWVDFHHFPLKVRKNCRVSKKNKQSVLFPAEKQEDLCKTLELTEDCESEDHVLHDFITQAAAEALRLFHRGLQLPLVHPDLHLLLHFVGTAKRKRRRDYIPD